MAVFVRQNNIIWINLFPLCEFIRLVYNYSCLSFNKIKNLFLDYSQVVILNILFIAFIVYNDFSIVLGDKSNHQMVAHLAQINHLIFFFIVFYPMINFKIFRLFYKEFYTKDNLTQLLIYQSIILLGMLIFNNFSFTHDFILSDNRHYSFYYFKYIYENMLYRYIMIGWSSLILALLLIDNENLIKDPLMLSFFICCVLILTPAKLFEFRYFNLCYISFMIILHYNYVKWKDIYYFIFNQFNIIWMILINLVTIFMFVKRPFKNDYFGGELSRFMW